MIYKSPIKDKSYNNKINTHFYLSQSNVLLYLAHLIGLILILNL